jgi:TonB-linked SusC/RagA family outer membrane protein
MSSKFLQSYATLHLNFFRCLPKILLLMLLISSAFVAKAQTVVKGKVIDEQGKALPGVGILLKGTNTSTSTQDNGSFSITTTGNNPILVFSYVGYTNKEIPVKGQSTINVTLETSSSELSQVVVVGYGTQRKEAVTGSVASIGGDKVREVPAPNIAQAIQGRLAGVNISQTSTKPGATMQILIRGQRSLSASNEPLVVLDGIPFPGSIGDINPNDIKSIDILKDASATAIYGSRGANGVILLTTNRGQLGAPAKISYNSYTGIQTLFAKYPMMDGPEFLALRKAAGLFTTLGVDEAEDVNTDWQDLFYNKNAIVTSHDLGVTGGSETSNYSFGGGYYKNQSLIPTQQYTRYSMKASLDQQIGKLFRLGFTTNNNYNLSEGNQVGIYGNLSNTPLSNRYNADGTLKRTIRMPQDEAYVFTNRIVKDLHDQWLNETRGFATYNSFYGEVKIPGVEGLKYRANVGLDFIQSNNGNYTGVGLGSTTATTPSTAGVGNSQTYHWTLENLLTYDRSFGKHNFNAVALFSAEQNKFNSSSMSARDIPSDAFQFYNLGQANGEITIGNGEYTLTGLVSYMGRVMYSYDDRFLLSATLRSDASSRLAPGHKWHTYPAVSVGWNLMNESFMKGITVVDKLKIRVGYGQTSNQAVNPYQTLGVLSSRPYNFGNSTYATGYYVSQLPSPGLGWEYSETWNYGLDFSVLKNRISGTFEYYNTKTKDILLNVGLPSTSGVGSYTANIGETQNKGWELSLNGVILEDQGGWTWDLGFNISANRNKLLALASGQTRDEGNAWFVGHNINSIFDFEKVGLWQAGDPHLNVLEPGGNVGMIKVRYTGEYDANGVPTRPIGAADRQIIDVDPDFTGGFNTRVAYKGFDLNVVGLFKSGGTLLSTLYGTNGYLNLLTGRRNNVKVDYWTPENTGAKYPKPGGIASGDNPKYGNTLGYFDASFLKIRTISLGYDFNRDLIKNSSARLRMYVTVQNPFVIFSPYHKESGMDPETNSFGNENQAVTSYQRRILAIGTNTPSTRNYVAGLNLTF